MVQQNTSQIHRWPGPGMGDRWLDPSDSGTAKSRRFRTYSLPSVSGTATDAFAANRLLATFRPDILNKLAVGLRRRKVATGDYLIHQDEWLETVYFPETAIVSDFLLLNDGRTVEVALTGSESAVGLPAVFGRRPAANGSQVCIGGTVIAVSSELLETEVNSEASVRHAFIQAVLDRMSYLSRRVTCNSFHSVEERFCNWLLTLTAISGRNSFPVTHEQIARALGVHRPSVTFIAQSLREKGLINYTRGRIAIRNLAGLTKQACGCGCETEFDSGRMEEYTTLPSFM